MPAARDLVDRVGERKAAARPQPVPGFDVQPRRLEQVAVGAELELAGGAVAQSTGREPR